MTPARHDGAHRPVALVTGAARRVGRAIAIALADAGFDLVLHAHRSEETLAELCAELAHSCTVRQVTADLRQAEGQDALSREVLDTTPRLDAVVHNAADYRRQPLCDLTRHDLTRMMALNLEAPLFVTRALLPALRRAPDPCVVHLGDSAADLPYPAHAPYLVSKAALHALTRALAVELAPMFGSTPWPRAPWPFPTIFPGPSAAASPGPSPSAEPARPTTWPGPCATWCWRPRSSPVRSWPWTAAGASPPEPLCTAQWGRSCYLVIFGAVLAFSFSDSSSGPWGCTA